MSTIPISQIVSVIPGVVGAGGQASKLSGAIITKNTAVLPGTPLHFFAAADVATFFGASSVEATMATEYFAGIVNGLQLPYELVFARFAAAAFGAEVAGASLKSITPASLNGQTGTLILATNTKSYTSTPITFSAVASFNDAATQMNAGFSGQSPDFTITYNAAQNRFEAATTATGTTTTITPITGTLAGAVFLSAAAGATIQAAGGTIDTPATAMARLVAAYTNWGLFTTAYDAEGGDDLNYSIWASAQNAQYGYVRWGFDTAGVTASNPAAFGTVVFANNYVGTMPLYADSTTAAFVLGYAASVNFSATNGRTNAAFRQPMAGATPGVTDLGTANALLSNNYSYYGAYANAANQYAILYDGKVSGPWKWLDTYIDEIYLNRELQRALFETLLAYRSLPFNQQGYDAIYAGAKPVLVQAVDSGIIRRNVALSASQIQQINNEIGFTITDVLQTEGWYLYIKPGTAQDRGNRQLPACTLYYCDGGSIQKINLASKTVL